MTGKNAPNISCLSKSNDSETDFIMMKLSMRVITFTYQKLIDILMYIQLLEFLTMI